MEAIDPILLNERQLQFRAASLNADRATKEIFRLLKADTLRKWANEQDAAKREALWHELQALQRFADKLEALANDAELIKRKEAVQKAKAELKQRQQGQW